MATPFSAIEDRTARAALRHAANAEATATLRFGETFSFQVIFDNAYAQALSVGPEMASAQPTALAIESDLAEISVGTPLEIREKRYTVVEMQPDGTGMVSLLLELAS